MCLPVFQNGLRLFFTELARQAHDALTELDHLVLQGLMTDVLENPTDLPWMLAHGLPLYGARRGGIYVTYHLVDEVVLVTQVTSHRERADNPTPGYWRGDQRMLETLLGDLLNCGEPIRVRRNSCWPELWRRASRGDLADPSIGRSRRKTDGLLPPELGS